MRVLHLCPLWFPISRNAQGGIETFLPALVSELEALGCENTILASGDSRTSARLISATPSSLVAAMARGEAWEYGVYEQHQLTLAVQAADRFDVIHSHIGWGGFVLSSIRPLKSRVLHTLHNPVTPDIEWFVRQHPDLELTAVSEFQAAGVREAGARCCRVVLNGIDPSAFTFRAEPGEGLVFVGRMEREKGPDMAVQTALALDMRLVLAGPIVDEAFFDEDVAPFLGEQIRYVGVVGHAAKNDLYGGAACALVPSRWDEPFGLVAIEAMACGTPVAAMNRGALPDIVEDGLTGWIAQGEEDLAGAVTRAVQLDRVEVRRRVEERFDVAISASGYLRVYGGMMEGEG